MQYALIPRYKFHPPHPMDEVEYSTAKLLQEKGSKKLYYLTSNSTLKFIKLLKIYGALFGGTGLIWYFLWIVSQYLPNSGAARMLDNNTFDGIMGFWVLLAFYSLYGWLWETLTCKNYNRKLHRIIKKSNSYNDFRSLYFKNYKVQ